MSYSKTVKQCQDAGVGFRAINEVADNQLEAKSMMTVEHLPPIEIQPVASIFGSHEGHGIRLDDDTLNQERAGGAHDTPKIARGSLVVVHDGLFAVNSPPFRVVYRTGVCSNGASHLGTGSLFVPTPGYGIAYADAWPLSDDNTTYRTVQTSSARDSAGDTVSGVYVSLWEQTTLSGPNLGFSLANFSFHLVVYARRLERFDPGADGFPWAATCGRRALEIRRPRSSIAHSNG